MHSEYDDQIEKAMLQHPLAYKAGKHILWRTRAMQRDQRKLASQLQLEYENGQYQDMSGAELQKTAVNYLDRELEHIRLFDIARRAPDGLPLPPQVSVHKLNIILPKVKAEFASDEDGDAGFHQLVQGVFNPDASFLAKWPVLRTESYWGSNKGTIESAKMLCFKFATSADTIATYAKTSIAHVTPTVNLPSTFQNSGSKFFTNTNVSGVWVPSFGFVHGGYAFGGQRGELKHFEFGPEDCSSIVHNWLDASVYKMPYNKPAILDQFSTIDQLYAWRKTQKRGLYFIDRTPEATKWSEYLKTTIQGQISAQKVKPGDIYLLRSALKINGSPDTHAKGSGHTGIVIGNDPDDASRVLVFECARDMEAEDPQKNIWGCAGAGIGSFQKIYEKERDDKIDRTMFLRPKF